MTDLAPFPNIKVAVIALLGDFGTVASRTPADLVDRLPYLRVTSRGSSEYDTHTDSATVDVDVFEATEYEVDQLAELVRQRFLSLPRVVPVGGGVVLLDRGRTVTGPQIVPWSSSEKIVRSVATYAVSTRRVGVN